ncbi:hypothetical protein KCU92_g4548, partial [Aureobasidium melanogenum]
MWENEKPRLLLKAQYLHNYLLLSKDFESLQTQAKSEETPLGKLYAEDRSKKRRRRTSNDRTRATFVLDHMVSVMYPQGATNKQKKEAKDRLTRDRDMANIVACFVKVFGIGILPLMFNSAWRSAFPQFKAESLEPCLRQLNEREPALKAIAEFVNANFYAYIQGRGRIPQRPVVGVGLKHRERAGFTVMELFNRPCQDLQQHEPVFNVFGEND